MNLSLIITTYNRPESLSLVLRSIEAQTILPDEIVIADDGSIFKTKEVINRFQKDSDLNIIHSWQEDKGFRVAKSRNKAIARSSGDYIVAIDGDTILHSRFIQDHINNAESGYFVQGSRALLTDNKTKQTIRNQSINLSFFSSGIKNRENSIHSSFLSKIFSTKKNSLRGIKSCNIAFYRQDCINVNGFNNEFEGWGREDSEFVVRLMNTGIIRKNIRFNAIQYHLWHKKNDIEYLDSNNQLLQNSIHQKHQFCNHGINQFL